MTAAGAPTNALLLLFAPSSGTRSESVRGISASFSPGAYSSTETRWATLAIIPRVDGVSCNSTV